ncbi:MAG: Eco57I restriction-modification methylase domain-containing protein, partial [Actinokineospora sp.]
ALGENTIPRTSYQRAMPPEDYIAGYKTWNGKPSNQFWRLAWRNMVDSSTVRSLHSAIIPPGPTHVHVVHTLATDEPTDLAVAAGFWASLPLDFFVKVAGASKVQAEFAARFPHVRGHGLEGELVLRALRLNCLTRAYEPLWSELFDPAWCADSWTHDRADRPALGAVARGWELATPLRTDFDRRQALVEIDAITAIMLGITANELCTIYRTQFGVLRKYERVMRFDVNGRQVPSDIVKAHDRDPAKADLGRHVLPFTPVDREKDMTRAHEVFTERLGRRTG